MKRFHLLTFLFAIISLGFTACKSDDPERANTFTIDGQNFQLDNAYVYSYGDGEFTVQMQNGSMNTDFSYIGLTNFLSIDINSSSLTELAAGTYPLNVEGGASAFTYAQIYTGITLDENGDWLNQTNSYGNVTGGTVTISKNGDTYTFDFTLIFGDRTITGYYRGTLEAREVVG